MWSLTGTESQSPPKLPQSKKTDTLCMKCYDDSIKMVFQSVKKDIRKMDSLSVNVNRNAQKIIDNNRSLNVFIKSGVVASDTDNVVNDDLDTMVIKRHINIKKK